MVAIQASTTLVRVRALVVDDSAEVRARIVALLRELESILSIAEATGADEAVAAAQMCAPDVVILDINMPGKSGLTILPLLRTIAPAAVVMVLTNDPTDHHRRECLARGAHFFFDKSKHFGAIVDVVRGRAPTTTS